MQYDMLSLGPARMDVFIKLPDDQVEGACNIDRKRCMIELGFGEKIPINRIDFAVGGNTGNNAVGLARLGLKVAMTGTMGDGWSDKQAMEMLKSEGVDMRYMCTAEGKVGFGVVINYAEERTILSYYPEMTCAFPEDGDLSTRWMYLTTAGENYEDFYRQAVEFSKAKGTKIAFNPGSRQIKQGFSKIRFVVEVAEVMFVNREEAAHLLGREIDVPVKELLAGLREVGAKTVVVTDGQSGSYADDGRKAMFMPIVDAPVVERTGAGDAFGSGFLAAVMQEKSLEEALGWGTVNSASVLGFVGPQAGLLNLQQIGEWLEKTRDVQVREI